MSLHSLRLAPWTDHQGVCVPSISISIGPTWHRTRIGYLDGTTNHIPYCSRSYNEHETVQSPSTPPLVVGIHANAIESIHPNASTGHVETTIHPCGIGLESKKHTPPNPTTSRRYKTRKWSRYTTCAPSHWSHYGWESKIWNCQIWQCHPRSLGWLENTPRIYEMVYGRRSTSLDSLCILH